MVQHQEIFLFLQDQISDVISATLPLSLYFYISIFCSQIFFHLHFCIIDDPSCHKCHQIIEFVFTKIETIFKTPSIIQNADSESI